MNPIIVMMKAQPHLAWLIDLESVVQRRDGDQKTQIATGAVFLADMRAGDMVIHPSGKWEMPRCGRLEDSGQDWVVPSVRPGMKVPEHFKPAHRGIYPDAARAMLDLSTLAAPIHIKGKNGSFTKPSAGWSVWKFLAAWRWSAWQDQYFASDKKEADLTARWEEMRAFGYGEKFGTFKVMLSRLDLHEQTSRKG